MTLPLTREPVEPTVRKRLTPKERAELWARQDGRCGCGCGAYLPVRMEMGLTGSWETGPAIDEHILPLELGGSNDLSNRALYLVECAKAKTREDLKRIRKAARLRRDADPSTRRRTKTPLKGRGFRRADDLKEPR